MNLAFDFKILWLRFFLVFVTLWSLALRQAFNCVSHEILTEKFAFYGVRGNALKLSDYLANRFMVRANDGDGVTLLRFNVLQGSIMGPV